VISSRLAASVPLKGIAPAAEAVSADGGYAATEHVQTYYKTAKL
jgi:hypothetical protein